MNSYRCFINYICILTLLAISLFNPNSIKADELPELLFTTVSYKSVPDWIEIKVNKTGIYGGYQVLEGSATLLKELPDIQFQEGDVIKLHFGAVNISDDNLLSGKGADNLWDFYTNDAGLIGTDDVLRIQRVSNPVITFENVVDAVIWSNNDNKFTASIPTVNSLSTVGHWQVADFSLSDQAAWGDSDDIDLNQGIQRVSLIDTNSKLDWEKFELNANIPIPSTTPDPLLFPTGESLNVEDTLVPTVVEDLNPTPIPLNIPPYVTPTVQSLVVSIPNKVNLQSELQFELKGEGYEHNQTYAIKMEARLFENEDWYEGKTKNASGKYLAWNAGWASFPIVTSSLDGKLIYNGAGVLTGDEAGKYEIRFKIRQIDNGHVYTSSISNIFADEAVAVSESDEINEVRKEESDKDDLNTKNDLSLSFITDISAMSLKNWVRIEGVVIAPPELLGSRVMYVEDESDGIKVLLDKKDQSNIKYLDYVEIFGQVGQSFNEKYIKVLSADDIRVIKEVGEISGQIIKTGEIGEDSEGRLVTVKGKVVATSGNIFYIDDGSGQVKIYIKDSTEIDKPRMSKGDDSIITGIVSQYNEEYRILPRFIEDLVLNPDIIPDEHGEVLGVGGVKELPKTGYSVSDLGLYLIWLGLIIKRIS